MATTARRPDGTEVDLTIKLIQLNWGEDIARRLKYQFTTSVCVKVSHITHILDAQYLFESNEIIDKIYHTFLRYVNNNPTALKADIL